MSECISEQIGRPLLSLTSADFGSDEADMEENLSDWFKLAETWGAVMLLDEADVWLEKRLVSDLKRNTLVAGTNSRSSRIRKLLILSDIQCFYDA